MSDSRHAPSPLSLGPSRVTVTLIAISILALLATVFASGHYRHGTPGSHLSAGAVLIIATLLVIMIGATFLPERVVFRWGLRPWVVITGIVLIVAVVLVGVFWHTPVLWLSRLTLAVLAVALGVGGALGFLIAGWLNLRRGATELARHQLQFAVVFPAVQLISWFLR